MFIINEINNEQGVENFRKFLVKSCGELWGNVYFYRRLL